MIRKINLIILILVMSILIVGCKQKKVTVINQVINQEITTNNIEDIKSLEDTLCNAVSIAKQSVVGVISVNSSSLLKQEKNGSGVVVKKDDDNYFIVTNYHVVANNSGNLNDQIYIYLGDLELTLNACVVVTNKQRDLAVLKVETDIYLSVAVIDKDALRCGQYVIAIGSPYDLKTYYNTVTFGHLSSIQRLIKENDTINSYLQHDATINAGSSGGGLFNLNGELIGINTWKINSDEAINMNFAVPATEIVSLISDI